MPSIEQFEMFVAVVDEGAVRQAAKKVHKTQPTVTAAIKKMESTLGLTLFNRDGYRMQPTTAGFRIYQLAREVLDKHHEVNALAQHLGDGHEPLISIAVEASFDLILITEPLRQIQQLFGHTQIDLSQEYMSGAFERLLNGSVELAISPVNAAFFPTGKMDVLPLSVGEFVNVASPAFVAKFDGLTSVRQLISEYQIVIRDSGTATRDVNFGVQQGQRTWLVNSFDTKKALIKSGLGWGSLPRSVIEQELVSGTLIPMLLSGFRPYTQVEYHLLKRSDKPMGPVLSKIWSLFSDFATH